VSMTCTKTVNSTSFGSLISGVGCTAMDIISICRVLISKKAV